MSSFGTKVRGALGIEEGVRILPMIGYNMANVFSGGSGYIIGLYFTAFLTDVENLSLTQAGIVTMLATLWDAVTDPAMGIITDRTRSRLGKHRRYLLWGIAPLIAAYIMMWYSFGISASGNTTATMWYYIAAYMLYKTAYTIIMVPHTAMLPEMAPEYSLRTQYNSVGYLMNSAGMVPSFLIFASVFGLFQMEDFTPASKTKFLVVAIILGAFYAVAALISFLSVHEKSSLDMVNPPFDGKYLVGEYVDVFKNKAFRQYFLISLTYMIATGFYSNSNYYFIKYVAGMNSSFNILNMIAGVAEAAAFPLNYMITIKHGKTKSGNMLTPVMLSGLLLGLFIQSATGSGAIRFLWIVLMYLRIILYPFGYSGIGYSTSNIFPDVTDVDEIITGRRREGVISTFSTLIKKSISGVMAAFVTAIMQLFGLVTGDAVSSYEALHEGMAYRQTGSAIFGVRLCSAIIPAVMTVISLVALRKFSMSRKDHNMIRAALAIKKRKGSVSLTDEQIKAIERISGQKYENTWLGSGNGDSKNTLETDENGSFVILDILKAEEKAAEAARHKKAQSKT